MVISNNLLAMNSKRQLGITNRSKAKSTEKLSSGYRINRAADDAAGLAISEKMRRQIRGMSQGVENTQDGISLCQVADGALAEVNEMLNRMTKLSIQAANGTNSESDRAAIQREINELKVEITKIGKTTEFNDKKVFYPNDIDEPLESITQLIQSPSAEKGYLAEAVKVGNYYYPTATLDFSNINAGNIHYLYNKSFSFECSENCKEQFSFTMIKGNGTQSKFDGVYGYPNPHHYIIDIGNVNSGEEIIDRIFDIISTEKPNSYTSSIAGELCVSHSNTISKNGSKLVIRASTNTNRRTTEEDALKVFPKKDYPNSGKIDFSELDFDIPEVTTGQNTTSIQTSGEQNDRVDLVIDYMNSGILGISMVDVTTEDGATAAIETIKDASAIISNQRSRIGAYQNRLEHTIANEKNIIENTTAAESQIRDTDMATEMVKYSNENILAQAGQSMLVQANQSKDGVLALLGNTEK